MAYFALLLLDFTCWLLVYSTYVGGGCVTWFRRRLLRMDAYAVGGNEKIVVSYD